MKHISTQEKRTVLSLVLTAAALAMPEMLVAATENLDEMIARKGRYATNAWPTTELEQASNNYIWQPETLMYTDVTTGHEVWVLTHAPDKQEIYSKEHGSMAWSHNGSRIGFFSTQRPTANTALGDYHWRWVVNTDGSGLRAVEGYGRKSIPYDGFSWAHTEDAYYSFGSHTNEQAGSAVYTLFKNSLDKSNRVTGSLVLDTSSVNTVPKDMTAEGISTDDKHATFRDACDCTARLLGTPNPIATTEIYFSNLGSAPQITSHWGIARYLGPSALGYSDPYGDHTSAKEVKFHAVYSPGSTGSWFIGQFSGTGVFTKFKAQGSSPDGGPKWEDWNGTSFGRDEIQVFSNGTGTPVSPYGLPYIGHPAFDRWGKHALIGTYTDNPLPGTRILNLQSMSLEPNYVLAYGKYDGQHHSWTGWTDHIIAVEPDYPAGSPTAYMINTNKWNADHTQAFQVVHTHYPGNSGNYNGYPRPSQSPDGTKVAFASTFLNNSGDDYPYIQWAVVYYPLPPIAIQTSVNAEKVRIAWERPSYTTRGWPNEATDAPPKAREIKGYHVWVSSEGNTGWSEISSSLVTNEYLDIDQPLNSTRYYAVTSEEYSRLESRTLSSIRRVVRDGAGNISDSEFAPAGKTSFWTTPPTAPSPSVFTMPVGSNYRLSWSEPLDKQIRYYNVYYSPNSEPPIEQRYRIASLPVGTSTYLDWLADKARPGYYRVTSVDRQGNESTEKRFGTAPTKVTGLRIVAIQ